MVTIPIRLPESGYSIYVTQEEDHWIDPLVPLLPSSQAIVLTTPTVSRHCLARLKKALLAQNISLTPLLIPDGEKFKNLSTVERIYRSLIRLRADRKTKILLLGGGVLGDMGGFAAATYLRGLPFIQIPTTLIGQVDSSIGGKLGVNLPEGKNLVGVFRQPQAVLCHIPFLKTLPEREMTGGLAEVLKYGVIADAALFDLVHKNRDQIRARNSQVLFEIIQKSAAIKADVVEKDEKETGKLRFTLNFGHTFGHAIERLTRYKKFHHGEAVAMGMIIAAKLSHRLGFCNQQSVDQLTAGIKGTGLATQPPAFSKLQWKRAIEVDKKSQGGMIQFIFMKEIGQVTIEPISPVELVKNL